MRIAVDAFGGDNAPVEVVAGAVKALGMDENLEIVLVGKPAVLADLLNEYGNPKRISVCEAQGHI